MKIALLGYGKMGKEIERIAIANGHFIVFKGGSSWQDHDLQEAEIIIEFSSPESGFDNVIRCLSLQKPIVSGTTGWNHLMPEAIAYCNKVEGSFFYASNYSLGVNIFFELNRVLANWMKTLPQFVPVVKEIHHTMKKDIPSGTAITLAEDILQNQSQLSNWTTEGVKDQLNIESIRLGEVPGTHEVRYESQTDDLHIRHLSHGRDGFAKGALFAAEFLKDKKGFYRMNDLLNLNS